MKDHYHTKLPTGRDIPLLAVGIIGIGTSGPIIAKSLIPVPSLIFLRNLIGGLLMLPFAISRREWKSKTQLISIYWSALAGMILAAHFLCFFWSMRLTSVATGTALTATQPIFAALFIKFKGGHIPKRSIGGMLIAFFSVLVITGVDLNLSIRSFQGDLLAIIGGALGASYMLIGSKVQKDISTSTFTSVCYLVCSLSVLPVVVLTSSPLSGFTTYDWLLLLALIIGAQLLGHTLFNLSLKRVSPVVVSLIVFFEVPVSAILALIWLGQQPPAGTIPGIIGLIFGCSIFVLRSNQEHQVRQ
ncbi:MAG: DMT family transporter [Actinobacteria bacterium]|nr:DMT family transporter [Actinomycetota bacterium]NBQ59821.1 DMT family transporter [Actinomycetota bacterium]NCU77894.1 DMT family transporter [Actinomycetota bacterium]NCU96436.1 DMT family transporter [Actinomycetota bacterium]NDD78301.1 DMT family transporter [Actinomycetota bacterium]